MILPDFASAADDMAILRRLLPLTSPEPVMRAISNDDLHILRDRIHQHIGMVLRAREGVHAHDGSQSLATAKATISAAQNAADELTDVLTAMRVEFICAFPAEAQAFAGRSMLPSPSHRPSPDAGFSGFASPAGA